MLRHTSDAPRGAGCGRVLHPGTQHEVHRQTTVAGGDGARWSLDASYRTCVDPSHRIERHVVGAALHFRPDEPNRTPLHTKQTSEVRGWMHLNAFNRTEARRGDMRRTFDTRQGT